MKPINPGLADAHDLAYEIIANLPDDPAIAMMALNLAVAEALLANSNSQEHAREGYQLFTNNLASLIDAKHPKKPIKKEAYH